MIRRFCGKEVLAADIFKRGAQGDEGVRAIVLGVIERVRKEGDQALYAYAEQFDKCKLTSLEVSEQEIKDAYNATDDYFKETLRLAADNLKRYHKEQGGKEYRIEEDGVTLGRRVLPLERVGIYVPGGTASYPSTVLMNAVPAKIAGVREIVMVTPPQKDGGVRKEILAAAYVAGVDRVFRVGGAQAVAALAYGTESVPKVDKIVGPGNMYVAAAKREVFGTVDIDMIAGPSEILIVADEGASPVVVAADLLGQAEHDRQAQAILVTTSDALAERTAAELERQLAELPRASIAREAIERYSAIVTVKDTDEAIEIANAVAPEHLELMIADPERCLDAVRHAGSVFLGYHTPEVLGDYLAGTNHTLPTNGTARFSSPLSVEVFQKKTSYLRYSRDKLEAIKDRLADFAEREGLSAHARSATKRF